MSESPRCPTCGRVTTRRTDYPKGKPLPRETLMALFHVNQVLDWSAMARRIGINRVTLNRLLAEGRVKPPTAQKVERFIAAWKNADDTEIARMHRRWSEKRRAAYERKRRAA